MYTVKEKVLKYQLRGAISSPSMKLVIPEHKRERAGDPEPDQAWVACQVPSDHLATINKAFQFLNEVLENKSDGALFIHQGSLAEMKIILSQLGAIRMEMKLLERHPALDPQKEYTLVIG